MTRVPFRWAWSRFVMAGFYGFVFLLVFGALFAQVEGGTELLVLQRLSCTVGSLLLAAIVVRCVRLGVFVNSEAVEVRNVLTTQRALWGDIVSIAPPAEYGTVRKAGLLITTADGREISATAMGRGIFEGPAGADEVVGYLQGLHRQYTTR